MLNDENNIKLHIDITIPFFLNNCIHRTNLTELVFKHYTNIKNKLSNKANITFTLVGSEEEISKNLALKYIDETDYHEFDQKLYNIFDNETFKTNIHTNNMWLLLTDKFRYCFKKSFEKNPDISLLFGSNDIVSCDYFNQIIDFYNPDENQLYGISAFNRGNNAVLFLYYNGLTNKFNENNDCFWWNGVSPDQRSVYNYCGATIGFNKHLYTQYYDELLNSIICHDEGIIEELTLKLPDVKEFISREVFYLNTKTLSNNDINNFVDLHSYFNSNIITYNIFNNKFIQKFQEEYNEIINL